MEIFYHSDTALVVYVGNCWRIEKDGVRPMNDLDKINYKKSVCDA